MTSTPDVPPRMPPSRGWLVAAGLLVGCSHDYTIVPGSSESVASTGSGASVTSSAGPGGLSGSGGDGSGGEASSSSGSSGGTGGGGGQGGEGAAGGAGGGDPECEEAIDCPPPDDDQECLGAVCDGGRCALAPRPAGTPLTLQPPGDCQILVCDGEGGQEAQHLDDPPPATACASFTCAEMEIVPDFADAGTSCGGAGLECDGNGNCTGCTTSLDCGADTECATPVCDGATGVCSVNLEPFGFDLDDPDPNCSRRICDGVGSPMTINDPTDVISDGKVCTTDTCSNQAAVHTPLGPGLTIGGCSGVCQGAPFAGECGLRVYSRLYPQAGAWSFQAASQVFGGGVPLGNILAAEMNGAGTRLMVWHGNGNVYERIAGVWQAGVASTARFPGLPSGGAVSSAIMANFGAPSDILVISTNESPPRACTYDVTPTGAPTASDPVQPCIVIPPESPPNQPPQDSVPMRWSFAEQRYVINGSEPQVEDLVVFWKGLQNTVYEQWYPSFTYQPAFPDATSLLQMNGVGDAPPPGAALAAYFDRTTGRVYVIAP